jgi:hypothetical protein
MSVTLDRFVRVMSGGVVVSDQLVTVRHGNALRALADARAQVARVGLAANPAFVARLRTLEQGITAAMQQADNQAKCEALDPVKLSLIALAERAKAEADQWATTAAPVRQKSDEAAAAISRADLAIQQIPDPVFRAPLETRLAGVQNRRIDAVTDQDLAALSRALPLLDGCTTDANAIAAEAAQAAQLFAERAGKLAPLNAALSGLLAANANILEAPQKNAADAVLAALTQQRDALANATADQIARELSRARALLADIATATATSNLRVAWSNTKPRRDVIRQDADDYAAAGKRDADAALEGAATKLKNDLTKLEALGLTKPKAAIDELPTLQSDHDKLKADFKDKVADSNVLQKARDLITANPDGPEAKMKAALGLDKNGKDVFEQRLVTVYKKARDLGSPEINLLSPGEAVAIHSYTCGDYAQMNGHLLGIDPLPEYDSSEMANRVLVEPTVDQVKIKNELACAALQKLPDWPGGRTLRGLRKRYSGDDEDFQKPTYTIKAFWSSSTSKPLFDGPWRFEIAGKSGKDVKNLSKYPSEDEVLYLPGTTFNVISSSRHSDENDRTCVTVVLKEV